MVSVNNAGLLLGILSRLEGGNLIPQFVDAGIILLLQLSANFVQSHEGARSVDIVFRLWPGLSAKRQRHKVKPASQRFGGHSHLKFPARGARNGALCRIGTAHRRRENPPADLIKLGRGVGPRGHSGSGRDTLVLSLTRSDRHLLRGFHRAIGVGCGTRGR